MAKSTAKSEDVSLWFKINEDKGGEVVYGDKSNYPPPGPDLTQELIGLHDERVK